MQLQGECSLGSHASHQTCLHCGGASGPAAGPSVAVTLVPSRIETEMNTPSLYCSIGLTLPRECVTMGGWYGCSSQHASSALQKENLVQLSKLLDV